VCIVVCVFSFFLCSFSRQYFDTVGRVFSPVKPVSHGTIITYKLTVLAGTTLLNPIQSNLLPFSRYRRIGIQFENGFSPSLPCLMPPSGGPPCNINVIYRRPTSLKSTCNGLQFRRWHFGIIFISLAVVASPNREIAKFRHNSTLQQFKVIDFGVNRKPMYDFLLVTNSNFGRICYRFRDIDA